MVDNKKLKRFLSILKEEEADSISDKIFNDIGRLRDVYELLRDARDEFGACPQTKNAIEGLEGSGSSHGMAKGYGALWDSFKKPEVLADIESWTMGKEQPWKDDAPEYMFAARAVELACRKGRKISPSKVSRKLKPEGPFRFMRQYSVFGKPSRAKVHIGDFMRYIETLKVKDGFSEDVAKTLAEIRKKKEMQDAEGAWISGIVEDDSKTDR